MGSEVRTLKTEEKIYIFLGISLFIASCLLIYLASVVENQNIEYNELLAQNANVTQLYDEIYSSSYNFVYCRHKDTFYMGRNDPNITQYVKSLYTMFRNVNDSYIMRQPIYCSDAIGGCGLYNGVKNDWIVANRICKSFQFDLEKMW